MSEQAAERICDCLNYYVKQSGKSIRELEKILAVYKGVRQKAYVFKHIKEQSIS